MKNIHTYNKILLFTCALLFSGTNGIASHIEEIYTEAVVLRKASSYIKAYEKFLKVEALNDNTDIGVRTLYNLGWVANKLRWYDTSAVHLFKSNEKNMELFGEEFTPAINSLNLLKERGQISEDTTLASFEDAHVNFDWTRGFIIGNSFSIMHTPSFIESGGLRCGKKLSMIGNSFNNFPLQSSGLHLYTHMSYSDFKNSLENSGLIITGEF